MGRSEVDWPGSKRKKANKPCIQNFSEGGRRRSDEGIAVRRRRTVWRGGCTQHRSADGPGRAAAPCRRPEQTSDQRSETRAAAAAAALELKPRARLGLLLSFSRRPAGRRAFLPPDRCRRECDRSRSAIAPPLELACSCCSGPYVYSV